MPNITFFVSDLLVVEPHTPKCEPVKYEKKDGQWYTHDGVDVKETQQRKGDYYQNNVACYKSSSSIRLSMDVNLEKWWDVFGLNVDS